jgi:hypothetical protein
LTGAGQTLSNRAKAFTRNIINWRRALLATITEGAAPMAHTSDQDRQSSAHGQRSEGAGMPVEWRAVRSMEARQRMEQPTARVRRDGKERELSADELVPGDIVLLEGGDVVPADLRLLKGQHLRATEAALICSDERQNAGETHDYDIRALWRDPTPSPPFAPSGLTSPRPSVTP